MASKFVPAERVKNILANAAAQLPMDTSVPCTARFLTGPLRASLHFKGVGKIEFSAGEMIGMVAQSRRKKPHQVVAVYADDKTLKGFNIS